MTDFGSKLTTEGFTKDVDWGLFRREEIRVELDMDMVKHNFMTLVTSVEDNTLLYSCGIREADIYKFLVKFCDQNMEVADIMNITKKIRNN